jgi:hypothetical protein
MASEKGYYELYKTAKRYIIDLRDNSELFIEPKGDKWVWNTFVDYHTLPGQNYDEYDTPEEAAIAGLNATAWFLAGKICDCQRAIAKIGGDKNA